MRLEFLGLDAADELMAFIRDHWSAGHVLSRSRELLDWQHRNEAEGRYNFLIARDDSEAIVGILGFIPSSRYDPTLGADRETVWLAVWKVVEGHSAGLGLMLLRELAKRLRSRWIGTVGLNMQVRPIYAAMGYKTGVLDRYYRLNDDIAVPQLATVPPGWPRSPVTGDTKLLALDHANFWSATEGLGLDKGDQAPAKSRALFEQRYLAHPFYAYRPYLAVADGSAALLMTRLCTHEGAAALRIVDLLGDMAALSSAGPAIDALLRESEAEYVDFYCASGGGALETAGFRKLAVDGELVLPSYFEPLERYNVDVLYALKGPGDDFMIGKGDGDQDRPNMLDSGH